MKVQAPFGFVTGCHAGDKFMVQATLASMRHYCPDVPICLTVDGDVDVSDLEREYNLIVLRIGDLPSAEMRKLVAGGFHAKHAAMWEGPFEYYVWLDSDAIVWGDFTPQVRTDVDFQIFWSEISIPADATEIPAWLPHFYFDPFKLRQLDPDFDWRGHAYFSAGVFACRRNAIPFERYVDVERGGSPDPRSVRIRAEQLQGRHGNAELPGPRDDTARRSENSYVRLATHSGPSRNSRVRAGLRWHWLAISRKHPQAAGCALLRAQTFSI